MAGRTLQQCILVNLFGNEHLTEGLGRLFFQPRVFHTKITGHQPLADISHGLTPVILSSRCQMHSRVMRPFQGPQHLRLPEL